MKRAFLILTTASLLSVSGNCQWYNRRYGASDINQLTQEQLNEALTWAQNKVTGGHVQSITGAIGIAVGSYLIVHSKKKYPEANDITEGGMTGWIFLAISIPVEIAGLLKWGINGTRVKSIKEVLKSTEIKMGIGNSQRIILGSSPQSSLVPCLSITVRF
jgi:hypothetical protein